ncbi:DUF72 domain-containing protein [candidate division KSB1 bacterium]|nr:DUF72 domain-containing protein [candidate division KSB1 bacterium]
MTEQSNSPVYIGPAGWNYKDWRGIVYPSSRPKGFRELRYLADFFNLVEINSTFYKIPSLESVEAWLEQVQHQRHFQFSIKLFQQFTHSDIPPENEQIDAFTKIIGLLRRENRLAALLMQFPWRFKKTPANISYLFKLAKLFQDFPCAIEFRHDSWMSDAILARLRERQIAFVNIDEPQHERSLPLSSVVTAEYAYLRLHGRNAEMWFNENSNIAQRYNYLYDSAEMDSIIQTIQEIRDKTGTLYIIFNNHFRGQAIVNAFQLIAKLYRQPPLIPVTLLDHYPHLRAIGRIKGDQQLSLF